MNDEEFYDWRLHRHLVYKHLNAPCLPVVELPPIEFEVKKMRFEKEFVGTGSCNEKFFRVKDSKKEIPFKNVILSEKYIEDIVEWLNENVPDKPKSFNEAVWDVIHDLWELEQIEVSELDGEFVVHEIKPTNIVVPTIKLGLDKYDVNEDSQKIDSCRNVFIIREKKNGV